MNKEGVSLQALVRDFFSWSYSHRNLEKWGWNRLQMIRCPVVGPRQTLLHLISPEHIFCIVCSEDLQWWRLLILLRQSVKAEKMNPSEFQTNPDVVELALNWNLQRASVWKNNQLCKGSEEPSLLCSWIIDVQGWETFTFPVLKEFSFSPTFTNTVSLVSTIKQHNATPLLLNDLPSRFITNARRRK